MKWLLSSLFGYTTSHRSKFFLLMKPIAPSMYCGILAWILEQKKDIRGKTRKNLNKVFDSLIVMYQY
jgi:hypothetical protein